MANRLKDYLNSTERDDFIQMTMLKDKAEDMLKGWGKRGNLSKMERKFAKYVMTYARKLSDAVLDRLSDKEQKTLANRVNTFEIMVVDKFRKQKLESDMQKVSAVVRLGQDSFLDFCCEIMAVRCNGCGTHHMECKELYKLLNDNYVPESGFNLPNCRYAYFEQKRVAGDDNKGDREPNKGNS